MNFRQRPVGIALVTGLLLAALPAQNRYVTSPPGGLPQEGDFSTLYFGVWADARFQNLDGKHIGSTGFTIHEVAFRPDYAGHGGRTGMGRTWTQVTLQVSETPRPDKFVADFAMNHLTTPSTVFQSKWSWPTLSGKPPLKPASWGGPTGTLRFPFRTPFVFTGKGGIVTDYTYAGGTLANNAAWAGSTQAPYGLDTEFTIPFVNGSVENLGIVLKGTQIFTPCGNQIYAWSQVSGGTQLWVHQHVSLISGAAGQPVIQALGTGASVQGVEIGALCNKLHVDLAKPHVLFSNKWGGAFTPIRRDWRFPWNNAWSGFVFYMQSAFIEDQSKRFALTHGVKLTVPRNVVFLNKGIYQIAGRGLPSGPFTQGYVRPYVRYRIN